MISLKRVSSLLLTSAVVVATALPSSALFAQAKPAAATRHAASPAKAKSAQQFPTLQYEKYKLPNGLEVILHEDHRLPLVAVNLWYHVGPANERPGRTGFA